MFFESFFGLIRVIAVGTIAYVALVVMLRVSGKRTLSKMNAFDLIITVAFGSTLATVLLSKDVALLEGLTAFALLIVLQFVVTWLSVRFGAVRKIVKSEPRLLMLRGEFLEEAMRSERYTKEEVHAAVRSSGIGSLSEVEAVIVETDGSVSVIRRTDADPLSAMHSVSGFTGRSAG